MATESAPVDISPEGPKTRSKLKRAKGSDSPSRDSSSCPSIKNKKKKFKKPKKNPGDGSSDDNSESSEDDYQYVIDGPNIDKRIKIKYMEEVGVEDVSFLYFLTFHIWILFLGNQRLERCSFQEGYSEQCSS